MSRMTAAADDRGFTVLELLIVIAVAGMVSVLAALQLPDVFDRLNVERLGSDIERELLQAGWRARTEGTDQVVLFDAPSRTLSFPSGRTIAFDDHTSASWLGTVEGLVDRSDGQLTLFGGGGASGGELQIVRGKHGMRVKIDWLSGRPSREFAR